MFRNLWRKWLNSRSSQRRRPACRKPARRYSLALESLEERTLLSVFNAPLVANLPDSPDAVATGHLRGAGAPLDAVTVNRHGTVSVLLGNGDGTFQSPVNISVDGSSFTHSLAVGDLLGNGIQDIVTSNGRTVQVLLGNGDGTFQSPLSVESVPLSVGDVTVGDFLGNGRQDILTVEHGRVSVLLSNGDGTFQAPIDTPIAGVEFNHFHQLAVGDFNHDGTPGLAVAASDGIEIFRGNGDGTFSLENTINLGTATYVGIFPNPVTVPIGATEVVTADVLGNGQTDLVAVTSDERIPNGTKDVRVFLGNGDGTFQDAVTLREPAYHQTTEGPFEVVDHVAVGDFTGHGKPDIVTFNFGTFYSSFINAPNFDVWVNNGDGTFHNLGAKAVSDQQFFHAVGDFRGNGKLDLLTLGGKSATVFLGNGDGTFNLAPTFRSGVAPAALVKADFTGSGRPQDLAVADGGGGVSVLLGNGDGTFRAPVTVSFGDGASSLGGLAVGDFLGNGRQDIAVASTSVYTGLSSVFVFLGNGDGTFQQTPLTLTLPGGLFATTVQSLAARDLNGDGKADLIVGSTVGTPTGLTSGVTVFLSNGDGTFQAPQTFDLGAAPIDLAVADLRGDGKLDLIATTRTTGGQSTVEVLLGNGDGTFQAPVTVFTGAGGHLAVGDFLGNGRQDILTYTADGILNLLVNNGGGSLQAPVTTQTGVSLGGVAVGDFVGNGQLGLAFTATDTGGVVVLLGNGDGSFQLAGGFLTGPRNPTSLVAGDFNGDGKLDLVVGDSEVFGFGSGTVTVLLNQGDGTTAAPPTVQSIVVNDGAVQRSEVTRLTVTFSTQVSLARGALEVRRADGSDVGINVATSVVGGKTVAVVTFTGPDIVDGSLPDGSYTLIVHSGLVQDSSGQTLAQDATLSFFRLLGDVDGDGVINDNDLAAAPTVTSVVLNEGDPTASQVHSITVHFSEGVTLGDGAFTLLRQDGSAITLNVSTTELNGDTVATITFSANDLLNGALPDGAYTFSIHGDHVHDGLGLALGHDFSGDHSADFFGADGAGQPDLVSLFHPAGSGSGG
jgi:hypothetical protein